MVIWTRWGILGLLIPVAFIVTAMIGAEALAERQTRGGDRKPVRQARVADGAEETLPEEDPEEAEAAARKRAADVRRQAAELGQASKRAKGTGYLVGGLASAAVLWPLGRRMNAGETRTVVDPRGGQFVEAQPGGGHTMFFIPLEYWGFIWTAIGLFKFLG